MSQLFVPNELLLWIYRERNGSPEFWAEPLNAVTNASFLIAAALACELAIRRRAMALQTIVLIVVSGVIGCGSFYFHTVPNYVSMWADIIPIALFQVIFLWLMSRNVLRLCQWKSAAVVLAVVGTSFLLLPLHEILNGSLFYFPVFAAMILFGIAWAERSEREKYLLLMAASCFLLALVARTSDMSMSWRQGTHFLWHTLNGVVVYLALRTWILVVERQSIGAQGEPVDSASNTVQAESVQVSSPVVERSF